MVLRRFPVFLHGNVFAVIWYREIAGVSLVDADDYDEIFAALRHPVRRQILLLLEDKGEASFTEIQSVLGLSDTGLVSYHLKELTPLVEQSRRGKYCLSEVGQASVTLFRKVEMEKDKTSGAVRREFERLIGEVFLLLCVGAVTMMVPLSVDIYLSLQAIYQSGLSMEQVFLTYFVALLGMTVGVLMFVLYDRHYFSRILRRNVIHAAIFAVAPALISLSSVYVMHSFGEITSANSSALMWLWSLGVLRSISFVIVAPVIAYVFSRFLRDHALQKQ